MTTPTALATAIDVLKRYTNAWTDDVVTPNNYPLPQHRESVSSGSAFSRYLGPIYKRPFLYRLSFLRQLSTVPLTTHLDATHTRFSHAIGTAKAASRILDNLRNSDVGDGEPPYDDVMYKACVFYSFIHDAFHGPMGHSLDLMKDVFGRGLEHKLDVGLLREALGDGAVDAEPPARAQLRVAARDCAGGDADALLERVRLLIDNRRLAREAPGFYFLRDVVDSEIDADRIDYLKRDGGVLDGWDGPKLMSLVESASTIVEHRADAKPLRRLAFSVEMQSFVADVLRLRRRLYSEHYEASDKLIVDDMICHGVFYTLRDLGVVDERTGPHSSREAQEILGAVMYLTDEDLFPAMFEIGAPLIARELFKRVRQHNYYAEAFRRAIPYAHSRELSEGYQNWARAIDDCKNEMAKQHGVDYWYKIREEGHIREFTRISEELFADETLLVWAYQAKVNGQFLLKIAVERRAWQRLLSSKDGDKAYTAFLAHEYPRGAIDREDDFRARHEKNPPLHITTSSSFHLRGPRDLERHAKEGVDSGVIFYSKRQGERPEIIRDRLDTDISQSYEGYPLVVSVPATLLQDFGRDRIRAAVLAELRSFWWLYESRV
jgi:hypothetical protein